jgi:ketosteroid isomerase-like protein
VSERRIELLRRWAEAYNARDIEALIGFCDPEVELRSVFAAVGGAIYHGHEGLRSWHRNMRDTWGEEIRVEDEAYFDLGEQMLVFAVLHGRGSQSGAEVTMPVALVTRWREDLIAYWRSYANRRDALRDLRVTEDELEPIDP